VSDTGAIARLKAGDIRGLATLVQRYQTKALRTAILITRDEGLAQEVVQAAFVTFYDRIEQFDSNRPFEPYFLRIVANDALKKVTRGSSAHTLPLESITLMDSKPSPERLTEHNERAEAIRMALGTLPPHERVVIVMRYYLGLDEAEMSQALDVPQGTIKSRLHRARKRLRSYLKEFAHGG
jgi:RNA polymerase sigma-70 factor (ECF subfamily)